jgi:glyoxylase-like metal-dependent hydrolase (beta-lactamase superfamily II)
MKEILKDMYSIKPSDKATFDSSKYIIDTKSDDGVLLIDPGLYSDFIRELEKNGFNPEDINHCFITHGHLDHYGACHELKKFNKDIAFYAHELDAGQIEEKQDHESIEEFYPGYDYDNIEISRRIRDNEILKLGQFEIKCIHTPGHSPGAMVYLVEMDELKVLFAGDIGGSTLRIYGGNHDDYIDSMQKIIDLNVDILCDGHEGAIKPAKKASNYVRGYMKFNEYLHIAVEKDPSNPKAWYDLVLQTYDLGEHAFALDFCNYLLEIDPKNDDANSLYKKIKKHNPSKMEFIKSILSRY